ncbi:MAG: class I SAM-dependent methyltransferase [Myxococcota bacterium]
MWDERYAEEGFAYGTEPNSFLAEIAPGLPRGRVLSLAEGEGRNAVFLASLGFEVHSVDQSAVGVDKTRALAAERGVTVHAEVGDLSAFTIPPASFDGIVSIFAHMPKPLRASVHARVVQGLRPDGWFVLEAYPPGQVGRGTGGPPVVELAMDPDDLRKELTGLEFEHFEELDREVVEGRYHTGLARVIQVVARKPS